MINRVLLVGRLGGNPETRTMPSGDILAIMRVACTEKYKTKTGEKKEDTQWVTVETWGQPAKFAAEYLTKGRLVLVEGQLRSDQYEKDGEKRTKNFVRAQKISAIGMGPDAGKLGDKSANSETEDLADLPF